MRVFSRPFFVCFTASTDLKWAIVMNFKDAEPSYRSLIDTDSYPYWEGARGSQEFRSQCQKAFQDTGVLQLPGFLKNQGVNALLGEVHDAREKSYCMDGQFSPYSNDLSEGDNTHLDDKNPRRAKLRARHRFIAGDRNS